MKNLKSLFIILALWLSINSLTNLVADLSDPVVITLKPTQAQLISYASANGWNDSMVIDGKHPDPLQWGITALKNDFMTKVANYDSIVASENLKNQSVTASKASMKDL